MPANRKAAPNSTARLPATWTCCDGHKLHRCVRVCAESVTLTSFRNSLNAGIQQAILASTKPNNAAESC